MMENYFQKAGVTGEELKSLLEGMKSKEMGIAAMADEKEVIRLKDLELDELKETDPREIYRIKSERKKLSAELYKKYGSPNTLDDNHPALKKLMKIKEEETEN